MLIFCDLETTGLYPERDHILEVAFLAVDAQLNPAGGFAAVVQRPNVRELITDPVVVRMHIENGLIAECIASEHALVEITDYTVAWLDSLWGSPQPGGKHTLAGDSVHFDLSFLRASMPRVADRFSHRLLDVSAFRVARELCGLAPCEIAGGGHRAQSDVLASIGKARWHLSRIAP